MGIYEELHVKTLINAAGTYTILGGSKMSEKTLADMADAARSFVQLRQLQKSVFEEIARLTKNEAAYVSNGAAAGLFLAIAAAVQIKCGEKRYYYLSKEEISRCNIAMFKAHRNPYDLVVDQLGLQYRELAFPNIISPATAEDLEEMLDENTAAFYYATASWTAAGDMPLPEVLKITKKKGIPVIVDAAAQVPPVENLWEITQMGADAVLFSGGKDLRGPQASGLMVGTNQFLSVVKSLGFPTYGIGRMLKVGREELVGLYSAIKQYVEMDHTARYNWCEEEIQKLIRALEGHPVFKASRSFPNEAGQPIARTLVEILDPSVSEKEVLAYLLENNPSIYAMSEQKGSFYINPMTLYEGEMDEIIKALKNFKKNKK